jgi:hypothetical protein
LAVTELSLDEEAVASKVAALHVIQVIQTLTPPLRRATDLAATFTNRLAAELAEDDAFASWFSTADRQLRLRKGSVRRRFRRGDATVGQMLLRIMETSGLTRAEMVEILGSLGHEAARVRSVQPQHLVDGTLGWGARQHRSDDCFAAALATCLQIPIEEVPDPRIDERLAAGDSVEDIDDDARDELERWLTGRNLRMVLHRVVPAARRRWIGIVPLRGAFTDHCVVMSDARLLFDPARPRLFKAEDVRFGLSFQALTSRKTNKEQPHAA